MLYLRRVLKQFLVMYRLIGIGRISAFGGIDNLHQSKMLRNFWSDTDYFTVALIMKMIIISIQLNSLN